MKTQIEVRIGSFANGLPRTATYHWSSCQPAHLRPDFVEGSRPNLGRKPRPDPPATDRLLNKQPVESDGANATTNNDSHATSNVECPQQPLRETERGNFKSTERGNFESTSDAVTRRPRRSTRNPNPNYVDAVTR